MNRDAQFSTPDPDLALLLAFLHEPVHTSDGVLARFARLKGAVARGRRPCRFVYVPATRPHPVLLVAHADTVWDDPSRERGASACRQELAVDADGIIRSADPQTGFGADDRAGCALAWLLHHELGHAVLITDGEEQRGKGSAWLMEAPENRDIAAAVNRDHAFLVQFDRRNDRDFKCYDVGTPAFRAHVARMTGYAETEQPSFTDIVNLCRDVCGVNLSIGYRDKHTAKESLSLAAWRQTLAVCRRWLAAPELPRFSR